MLNVTTTGTFWEYGRSGWPRWPAAAPAPHATAGTAAAVNLLFCITCDQRRKQSDDFRYVREALPLISNCQKRSGVQVSHCHGHCNMPGAGNKDAAPAEDATDAASGAEAGGGVSPHADDHEHQAAAAERLIQELGINK